MTNKNRANIFISYSWGEGNGENFATWLNQFLVENYDVNVFFDKTSTYPGTNLKSFMSEATKVKYVICVCTNEYLKRMEVESSGVKYEVDRIKVNHDSHIIPLVEASKKLPEPFKDLKYIKLDMNNPTNPENIKAYYELLNYIFPDEVNHVSTEYKQQVRKVKNMGEIKHSLAFNPNDNGIVTLSLDVNDGKVDIGKDKQKFTISWSMGGNDSVYIYNDYIGNCLYVSHNANSFKLTKMPIDLISYFTSYKRAQLIYKGDSFAFINKDEFILVGEVINIASSNIKFKYKILQQ